MAALIQLPADATPEERLAAMQQELANMNETVGQLCSEMRDTATKQDISDIKTLIGDFIKKADEDYVSKESIATLVADVALLKKLVYGAVAIILVAFIGALVALVIR